LQNKVNEASGKSDALKTWMPLLPALLHFGMQSGARRR
jgi:hypothetical protein